MYAGIHDNGRSGINKPAATPGDILEMILHEYNVPFFPFQRMHICNRNMMDGTFILAAES